MESIVSSTFDVELKPSEEEQEDIANIIPLAIHQGKDINIGLIRQIIKEVGISMGKWQEL